MNQKPVVVGIAYYQPELFRLAIQEARQLNTDVRVVHVEHTSERPDPKVRDGRLFDQLRAVAAAEPDTPPIEYRSWWGDPVDVLINESFDASEVLVGVDEVPWIARLIGGEVARKVAEGAGCPVLVVPPRLPETRWTGGIVVAIDTSDRVDAPLRFAFEAARRTGQSLQIVEAAGSHAGYPAREARRYQLEDVIAPWRERYPGVRVVPAVEGSPAVSTCVLATRHASLLVLGRPRDEHAPMSPEAVAARVLRHTQAAVAVVPLDLEAPLAALAPH
jgi:nucleotide-binding universal stress UspA family protein